VPATRGVRVRSRELLGRALPRQELAGAGGAAAPGGALPDSVESVQAFGRTASAADWQHPLGVPVQGARRQAPGARHDEQSAKCSARHDRNQDPIACQLWARLVVLSLQERGGFRLLGGHSQPRCHHMLQQANAVGEVTVDCSKDCPGAKIHDF